MEFLRQVDIDAFLVGLDGFAESVRPVVAAFQEFSRVYYGMAEIQYRLENDKLPGSDRTKRLRKKRQKRILDWFGKKLEDSAKGYNLGG